MDIFKRQSKSRCLSLAFGCTILTALALPFSTALTNVFSIATIVFWILGADLKSDFRRLLGKTFSCALLLFLLFVCLSVFWKEGSWQSYWSELKNYRRFIFLLIVFLLVQEKEEWSEGVIFAFYISTAFLTLVCIGIYLGLPFFPPQQPGQGAVLSKSHIAQGFLLGCHIVIAIRYLVFSKHIELKVLAAITGSLTFVVTVFMTYGRTGYLCVVLAIILATVFFSLKRKKQWMKYFLGALVIAVAMVSYSNHVQTRWDNAQTDIVRFEHGDMDSSMGLRFYFWKTSLNIIKDNPVIGVGCGSIRAVSCRYAEGSPNEDGSCFDFPNPHQDYLFVIAQYGIVGFLLWLAFFCGIGKECFRCSQEDKWTIFGITTLYLAGSFFNTFSRDITECTAFVILIAALLALANRAQSEENPDTI